MLSHRQDGEREIEMKNYFKIIFKMLYVVFWVVIIGMYAYFIISYVDVINCQGYLWDNPIKEHTWNLFVRMVNWHK